MSKGPSLTFLLIGIIVFVGVVTLSFNAYSQFLTDNAQTMDPTYAAAFNNITSQKDSLTSFTGSFSLTPTTLWQSIVNAPQNILLVAAVGLSSLTMLLQLPNFILNITNTLSQVTHLPEPIFWLISTILFVYVTSKFIKAVRGNIEEA